MGVRDGGTSSCANSPSSTTNSSARSPPSRRRDETGTRSHTLPVEARDYHTRDDHRHSEIDACTAAEVALGGFLEDHLADLADGAEQAGALLKEATGVVELCRLAETLAELPMSVDRVIGRLAGPRNNAAHRGDRLDQDTSRHAYQTAKALLERFGPLPGPDRSSASGREFLGRRAVPTRAGHYFER